MSFGSVRVRKATKTAGSGDRDSRRPGVPGAALALAGSFGRAVTNWWRACTASARSGPRRAPCVRRGVHPEGRTAAALRRFGAVLVLALAGLAAPLSAAQAQTELWSATMTAGTASFNNQVFGWDHLTNFTGDSLSGSNGFVYGEMRYDLGQLSVESGTLRVAFAPLRAGDIATKATRDKLTFHAGGTAFKLSEGTYDDSSTKAISWDNSGLTWAAGDMVALKMTTTDPGAPALTATPGPAKVTLNWTAPAISGGSAITGYEYRLRTGDDYADDAWTAIPNSASLTSYDVPSLSVGTAYTFQLRALNSSGAGLHSEEASATPTAVVWSVTADRSTIVEDGEPSTVTVSTGGATFTAAKTITLEFSGSAVTSVGEDFEVHRADGTQLPSTGTFTLAAGETEVTATVTALADAVDDPGEIIVIQAKVGAGTAVDPKVDIGDPVTITISEIEPPGAPRNLSATAGTGKVRLAWQAPASDGGNAITGYEYQRKEGGGNFGGWTTAETVAFGTASNSAILRDATTLDHYDVKAETTYTYRVRAVNGGGGGDASAEDSATTGAPMTVKVVVAEPEVFENEGPVEVEVVAELPATGPNEEKYDLEFQVDFFTDSITASGSGPDSDYTPFAEQPVFAPGDFDMESGRWVARKRETVRLVNDDVAEPDETFTVEVEKRTSVTSPSHPFVTFPGATDTATVTITNDDEAAITLAFEIEGLDPSGNNEVERNEDAGTITIGLRAQTAVAAAPVEDFEVMLRTVEQTAKSPGDFVAPAPALTYAFRAGDFVLENGKYALTVTKEIQIVDDEVVEKTEYFEVSVDTDVLPGHVTIPSSEAKVVVEIHDEDTTSVRVVDNNVRVDEGEEFQLTLAADHEVAFAFQVTLTFSPTDGTGMIDRYLEPDEEGGFIHSRHAKFLAGQRRVTLTIGTVEDRVDEAEVSLDVTLVRSGLDPAIALVLDPVTIVTIVDDDHAPEIPREQLRVLVGQTDAGRLPAVDADGDPLTWSLIGGADEALFTLSEDGQLSLRDPRPSLEDPGDANGDKIYELTVQVTDGFNPVDGAITVKLFDESVPSAPTGFRWLRAADEGGTATLTWGPPSDDGNRPILRYEIRTDAGAWETVPGGGDAREIAFADLNYNQLYIYGLRAVNEVGPSGQTTVENVLLRPGAPGAPRSLSSEAVGVHEIRLTWERPSHGADIEIVGYRFEVSPDGRDWSYSSFTLDRAYEERTYGVAGIAGDEFRLDDPTPSTRDSIGHEAARHYRVEALYVYRPAADDPYVGTGRSPVSAPVRASTEGWADTHPLAGFVLKDRTYLGPRLRVEDGATLVLSDPDGASHSIEALREHGASVGSVELELSGRLSHRRTDNAAPYNLFGDGVGTAAGRALPAGDYTLTATAYAEADGGGTAIQTRFVSFEVEGPPPPTRLTGLVLDDKGTNNEIAVADGATVYLPADGRYRLRAKVARGTTVGSVRLRLDGPPRVWTYLDIDNAAPYALTPGEGAMPAGTYRFRAWAWSGPDGYRDLLEMLEVSFTVAEPVLTGFELVDASADEDRGPVEGGGTLTVEQGVDYTFRAEAAADAGVKSVRLALEGPASSDVVVRTENAAPYTLHGEDGGDYAGAELAKGSYTLTATAFPRTGGAGKSLQTLRVSFTVLVTAPLTVDDDPEPLTAAFEDVPERHAAVPFEFRVVFSEAVDIAEDEFRDHALDVTGGRVTAAARVADETGAWTVTVAPDAIGAVVLSLSPGRDCDLDGALCTADGRSLAHGRSIALGGPWVLTGFVLVDAEAGADLGPVADGATVRVADPAGGSYDLRVESAAQAAVGSVRVELAGAAPEDAQEERVEVARTVDRAPYSLYRDSDGKALGAALPAGSYTLTATAYAGPGGTGAVLDSLSVVFTVAPTVLSGFVLVDATAHADLGAVEGGARLTELDAAKDYGFRAEVAANGGVESVTLVLSGSGAGRRGVADRELRAVVALWRQRRQRARRGAAGGVVHADGDGVVRGQGHRRGAADAQGLVHGGRGAAGAGGRAAER